MKLCLRRFWNFISNTTKLLSGTLKSKLNSLCNNSTVTKTIGILILLLVSADCGMEFGMKMFGKLSVTNIY